MHIAFLIFSTALGRNVFIFDEAAAQTFAAEQTEHTGVPHTAEPIEVHDDATEIEAKIEEQTKASVIARMTPLEKKAFGIVDAPAEPAVEEEPATEKAPIAKH